MGLISAGGTKEPSKSCEYMLLNLPLPLVPLGADLEGGRGTNMPEEEVCLLLMALADLALSWASLKIVSPLIVSVGPEGGVSLAFADLDLGLLLSRVLGLFAGSAILTS